MRGRMMQMPLLVSSLIEHAYRVHGDREVVSRTMDGSVHRSSWGEVRTRSKCLAGALQARGIVTADRLATLGWNTHRHLEIYLGTSSMGAVCHTVNPRLHPSQLVYILNHAADRVLFVDPPFLPLVEAVVDKLDSIETHVILCGADELPDTSLPGAISYEEVLAEHDGEYSWPVLDENAASALCYTSGTTGNPKGALYSHRSTVLHAYGILQPDVFGLGRSSVVLPIVPMFHASAWGMPYATAAAGSKLVFPGPRLDPEGLTEQLWDEAVTHCAGVPSVFIPLLQHWRTTGAERPPSLEMMVIGGSAPPRALIEAIEGEFDIVFRHAWGMTEMSPLGSSNVLTPEQRAEPAKQRSAYHTKQGRPPFGVELRIVGEDGDILPNDGVAFGELQVRGPWVVDGYFASDEHKLTPDGWFPTGDVATLDPTCNIHITDRTKDLIKSGGEWISSIDVENTAMGHPGITMAAVIGVEDEKWGERPILIAVAATDPPPSFDSVIEYLEGTLAKWQLPDEVIFVDALPMGATGKVQKTQLREKYGKS
ncbi:MAG: long-chain fatty acid--CoA ligase [Gemmatimonadota bacterium]|nr:long-chain fatty acid--CoA ligase [Gemmatimonadota bacterium]MDH3422444.1 long-chain fatty acid--CoA ligase [Gemmatimonadota bacterium]